MNRQIILKPRTKLRGTIHIPGDKSISHRGVMFGSIASGITEITNFLQGADCLATIACFQNMGIEITQNEDTVVVHGKGLHGLSAPATVLDVGNSGTTARLMAGILAGQPFASTLTGDESLNSRPMKRIIEPLKKMGAHISSVHHNDCAPLRIAPSSSFSKNENSLAFVDLSKSEDCLVNAKIGTISPRSSLIGIHYTSPVASAQVKSCILLAGLYAQGETSVSEPNLSRNHTELMLKEFGAMVSTVRGDFFEHSPLHNDVPISMLAKAELEKSTSVATATIYPPDQLFGRKIHVPGDISSAAFFIAAGLLVSNSEILLRNVGINPTRAGILKVCETMGARLQLINEKTAGGEPTADILVSTGDLQGTIIEGDIIPTLIDEIPIIAVMAAMAKGTTVIKDAGELRVKETDRIKTVVDNLAAMGCDITATDDGMVIHGGNPLKGAVIQPLYDHRIAMAFSIAALVAEGETTILDAHCVDVSFPGFYELLGDLS